MADSGQESPSTAGENRADGPPDVLESIEDLAPSEAQKYELRGGKYHRI
jgi:hypothetical protein